jgi:hypothetical protein
MVDFFGGDSWLLDASVDIPPGVDPRGGVKARYLPA